MKYRKYIMVNIKKISSLLAALLLSACSTMQNSDSQQNQAGREPASMNGNTKWLEKVADDFDRIAAQTSDRVLASNGQNQKVLMSKNNWLFQYNESANKYMLKLNKRSYSMVRTSLNDGEYSFVSNGEHAHPITLTVIDDADVRKLASNSKHCESQLSYANESGDYRSDILHLSGKSCEKLLQNLRSFVP